MLELKYLENLEWEDGRGLYKAWFFIVDRILPAADVVEEARGV